MMYVTQINGKFYSPSHVILSRYHVNNICIFPFSRHTIHDFTYVLDLLNDVSHILFLRFIILSYTVSN